MPQLTSKEVLQKVAEAATDSAAKQYDDLAKTFSALDAKAQAASTGGGVLLGVIVALANSGKLNKLMIAGVDWAVVTVFLAVLAAVAGMILGVIGSKVMSISAPYDAMRQMKEFKDYWKTSEKQGQAIDHDDLLGFHASRHDQWSISLNDMSCAIHKKARRVHAAQWCLLVSTVLTTVVVFCARSTA